MDGSAAPFIYLIQEAGLKQLPAPRRYLKIIRPISLSRGDKRIALYPSDHFKITYSIAFDHPLLRHQSRTIRLTEEAFVDEIAPARTFGFLEEVERMRQQGLALGGSLENAIVIGDTGVLNNALRFDDEFVRHKILDVIGDMALVGYPIIGHLVAHRGGHALHTEFAAARARGSRSLDARRSAGAAVCCRTDGRLREERRASAQLTNPGWTDEIVVSGFSRTVACEAGPLARLSIFRLPRSS